MDTSTSYLGFRLPHPFIAGASPLGFDLDTIKRLEDGGCSAIVIPSLFEEQITLASQGRIHHRDPLDPVWAESLAHFPEAADYALAPDKYAEHISRAKRTVGIPIVASLNGTSGESWLTFARLIEQAGADALELNLYEVVTDLRIPGAAVERQLAETVKELKRLVKIPIAVKLSPFFAAFGNVATQLDEAGADGLVLFNRAKVCRVRARQVQSPDERGRLAAEYRRYINLARSSGQRSSAAIIITHGLAGSGKTTSSQWLLERLGAIRIRTDVERKRLHGVGIAEGSDSPLGKGRCTSPTPRAEPIRVSVSWRAGQPPMATSLSSTARSCSAANAICFVRRHRRSACRL
jgi:dihydroorotate dehydrogenase